MNHLRIKPRVIFIPVLLSSMLIRTALAEDNTAAVKSLDSITSQSSDIPSLLMDMPVTLPDAEVFAAPKPKAAPLRKSASYRLQTSQVQTDALNAQIAALKAEQEKRLAELTKQYTSTQDASTKAQAAQQQKLADSEKQLADVQTKLQTATQQMERANKRIAELTATRLDEGAETVKLKQSLADSQNQATALTKKLSALTADQAAKTSELATVKKALAESDAKSTGLQTKWQEATAKIDAQTKQMASLRSAPQTPAPVSKEEIRAYALGAFWGHDVLNAMKKVESDGFRVSQLQVVSGVTDMMSGKFKIPKEKMLAELQEMDASVTAKTPPAPGNAAANDYIAKYSKKPGVKKSEMGYYYRITEKGRGAIKNSDTVAITVTESLANGKVIKDMSKTGKVLALPLDSFPPLFKTAISKLNNQGKLQMVVPPELAYGEAGSPPDIPPNATMVYDLKVVSSRPAK